MCTGATGTFAVAAAVRGGPELAFGAAEAAREAGFALTLVVPSPGTPARPLLAHGDGFVIVDPQVGDPFVPLLIESGAPVLAAERVLEGPEPAVTVETDHASAIRRLPLIKRPGIAESIDWARAAEVLHRDGAPWPEALQRSLGLIVKDQEDFDAVLEAELI